MTFKEYIPLAQRTSPEGHNRTLNGIMGLIGECGEVVDIIKKWVFQSGDDAELPKEKMVEELGDVMWYVVETMAGLGIANELYFTEPATFPEVPYPKLWYVTRALKMSRSAAQICEIMAGSSYMYETNWTKAELLKPVSDPIHAYLCEIFTCVGIMSVDGIGYPFTSVLQRNIEKLMKRYPNGFEAERSVNRAAYEGAGDE